MIERVVVVGLGYVGLPLAMALSNFHEVVGLDIDKGRIVELRNKIDRTGEIDFSNFTQVPTFVNDPTAVSAASFVIVTVPTPIDSANRPDLTALESASRMVGENLASGTIVVFESTVFPGLSEEICVPILEQHSGLACGLDFFIGYSPERINPGDKVHTLATVVKVIAGQNPQVVERMTAVYGAVCGAGLHVAPTIRVAEAAKVIENTQRDVNIALMNELALIFDRLDISTKDVLAAARTKWNFLNFVPGLVGGHCIGVDPYYLTHKAQETGYHPDVILSGRRVNDSMGAFIAGKAVKLLASRGISPLGSTVGVLGLTFKEDVPDLRNSRVPDIITELNEYGVHVLVHDPVAPAAGAENEYNLTLSGWEQFVDCDAVILAVSHKWYLDRIPEVISKIRENGVLVDVKGAVSADSVREDIRYWTL